SEVAAKAFDAQSFRAKGPEHRAAGNENGVDAGLCELAAKVATDSADADHGDLQSMRTTPSATLGKRVRTAGSCPGMISSGLAAIVFIRSCACRFDSRSNVCAIGACFSRFSYRYMLSDARTTFPDRVVTLMYCDCQVCFPPM